MRNVVAVVPGGVVVQCEFNRDLSRQYDLAKLLIRFHVSMRFDDVAQWKRPVDMRT